MTLSPLNAVSPIDGRYYRYTAVLSDYFSEEALIRYRVKVEVEYFISLVEMGIPELSEFDHSNFEQLIDIYRNFSSADAELIKATEKITNHDVKAVEYFIKEKFVDLNIEQFKEFIHFGLTSQDINNTATPMMLRDGIKEVYMPLLAKVVAQLKEKAITWKDVSMLARTHGQPASPTKLGKEFMVFVERIENQVAQLKAVPYSAKFGGATGNLNAHHVAFPEIDWVVFSNQFVSEKLGLTRSQITTQIEHYDNLAALFDALKRINTILIDLNRDMWMYISTDYFKQKIKEGEIGSSAMPHKVNPIDFENAEGNLGMANALFEHLSAKLPISRLQRDLTDSTVLRNIGVPIGHTVIALNSLAKGLDKLLINKDQIARTLNENYAVLAEAIQTVLRSTGYPNPYEALKELTRTNKKITAASIAEFIENLDVDENVKIRLKKITPENYTGVELF
jgi:adenylosuccinate lyase